MVILSEATCSLFPHPCHCIRAFDLAVESEPTRRALLPTERERKRLKYRNTTVARAIRVVITNVRNDAQRQALDCDVCALRLHATIVLLFVLLIIGVNTAVIIEFSTSIIVVVVVVAMHALGT
jgi:hypothetical protein